MSESVFGLSEIIQSLLHRVVRVIEMNQLQASVSAGNCNSAIVRVDSALFAQKLHILITRLGVAPHRSKGLILLRFYDGLELILCFPLRQRFTIKDESIKRLEASF